MSSIPCCVTESNLNSKSSNLPWKEFFESASFRLADTKIRGEFHASSVAHSPDRILDPYSSTSIQTEQDICRASSFTSPKASSPQSECFPQIANETNTSETKTKESKQRSFLFRTQMWLAVYVTLAQAGLALSIYGFFKLNEENLLPIIWASLCSSPLRGILEILLKFWSETLQTGLYEAFLTFLILLLRACLGIIIDVHDVISGVLRPEKLQNVVP